MDGPFKSAMARRENAVLFQFRQATLTWNARPIQMSTDPAPASRIPYEVTPIPFGEVTWSNTPFGPDICHLVL